MLTGVLANFTLERGCTSSKVHAHLQSCFELLSALVIASAITRAGMAEGNCPLGSGSPPTGSSNATQPSSLLTLYGTRQVRQSYLLTVLIFTVFER